MRLTIIVLSVLFQLASGFAEAAGKGSDPIPEYFRSSGDATRAPVPDDFDSGSGYVVGPLAGQVGWSTVGGSTTDPAISAANPAGGDQHLTLGGDGGLAPGTTIAAISPTHPTCACRNSVTFEFNVSAGRGADYYVQAQYSVDSTVLWVVNIDSLGNIWVNDGTSYWDTGVAWTPGTYGQLFVEILVGSKSRVVPMINVSYNGVPIFSRQIPGWGVFDEVVFFHDNWQNPGEVGDFDSLVVDQNVPVELLSFDVN